MTVTKLRWTILIISFLILILGGWIGLYLGGFLPTYACPYVGGSRGGVCFLFRLQFLLSNTSLEAFIGLAKHVLYFSLLVILIGAGMVRLDLSSRTRSGSPRFDEKKASYGLYKVFRATSGRFDMREVDFFLYRLVNPPMGGISPLRASRGK